MARPHPLYIIGRRVDSPVASINSSPDDLSIKIGFFFTERRGGEIIFNGNKECILITGKFDAIEKFMKDVEEEQQVQEQKENKELKERVDALEALLKLK